MKKNKLIIIIAIIVLLIAMIFIIINSNQKEKEYQIEDVKEYNYFVLKEGELYGVLDKQGNKIIEPKYEEVVIPNPEKAIFVCYESENTKIFNEKQQQILERYNNPEAIRLKNISSDLMYEKSVLKYQKDGKYGLIDFNGKVLAEPIYDEIESLQYKEGELLVKQNEKYGIINIKGAEILPIEYEEISSDAYYSEENEYKYSGYIVGIKTEEGYRYGYINYKGEEVLKTEYNDIIRVNEEVDENEENAYIICAKNGQFGVNKNEQNIIKNEYQSIRYDENNKLFVVEKSGKYGVDNLEGKEIIPIQYTQIDITGIYIYAQNDQGVTVYNKDGTQASVDVNVVIQNTENSQYKITIRNNQQETKYGVTNASGKQLIEEKYNYIKYLYDNYFIVSFQNGKLGVLDDKENIKIELNNDSLQVIEGTQLIQTVLGENTRTIFKRLSKDM